MNDIASETPASAEPDAVNQGAGAAPDSGAAHASSDRHVQPLLVKVLQSALRQSGLRLTPHEISDGLPDAPDLLLEGNEEASRQWCVQALARRGMVAEWRSVSLEAMADSLLPVVLQLHQGMAVLCEKSGDDRFSVVMPGESEAPRLMTLGQLQSAYAGIALFFKPETRLDDRASDLITLSKKHWFWHTVWRFKPYLAEAVAWSVIINVLSLAGALFSMTVYNRILPNHAYVTLWSMAIGVCVALVFEISARLLRAWLLDRAGKKIDLVLGAAIYRHVLSIRLENRAQSTGAFANVVGSFETVREFVASATLTVVADLPFAFLFLAVIAVIAGPLMWVVLAAIVLVAAIALVIQLPIKRQAEEMMSLGSGRHGLVVESLDNLEMVKALRAENALALRHDATSVRLAELSMHSRHLSTMATTMITAVQQLATVCTLVWGTYLVGEGKISMGAIIAVMTLMSRALMPISMLAGLAVRFQQARNSLQALNKIMASPVERDPARSYVHVGSGKTEIECRNLSFRYNPMLPPVVDGLDLVIREGERVAILGRMGSGKSTLLRLLVGLYQPTQGDVNIDGVDLKQLEPSDVRARIALVSQEPRLLYGSLRDNLLLAAPHATDAEMLRVAEITGVKAIAARHPMGFSMPVGERGETLSGGQKQAIALARALLARPHVLLLDEPTSGMDMGSERMVLNALKPVTEGRTVVIVTHKPALLEFVDRIIVMDEGIRVADGPKATIIEAINSGKVPSAAAVRNAHKSMPQPAAA